MRDPDHQLLILGRRADAMQAQLDAFDSDPRDYGQVPEMDGMLDRHDAVLRRIAAMPALTIAGLRVKANCVLAYRDPSDPVNEEDVDVQIAVSICRDLARLEAATI